MEVISWLVVLGVTNGMTGIIVHALAKYAGEKDVPKVKKRGPIR